jgi:hypothetical protein
MRRMTWILMALAVVSLTAAPALAQHGRGRGPGYGHRGGHGHYAPVRQHYGYRGHYVPNYKQLWLNSTPSYYHAPYTRQYLPGCYGPQYGGHFGYRGSSFGFHVRF